MSDAEICLGIDSACPVWFYAVLSDLIHCAVLEIWHPFGRAIALLALSAAMSAQGVSKQGDA